MDLLQQIVARAKADKQRIVLPEAEEERTLKAADKVLADDIADIILIGNPANIHKLAKEWGLENIDKATIVNPSDNPKSEEYAALKQFVDLTDSLSKQNKAVREMNAELEEKVRAKYALLTDEEILDLLVNRKWYATIFEGIKALYVTTSHQMTTRIVELVERYEDTLPELSAAVAEYEAKVEAHLKRMGFVW